jgi:hypothetical protein
VIRSHHRAPSSFQDESETDDDSDEISVESRSPADDLWNTLSIDLDTKLRVELKPEGLSSNSPEILDKLREALLQYQESHFDTVLRDSKFSNQNQRAIIASEGTCIPSIYCDTDTAGLVCFTNYAISVTKRVSVILLDQTGRQADASSPKRRSI